MCNITTKSKRKTAIIYKLCIKGDNEFYSFFAGRIIKIGKFNPDNYISKYNGCNFSTYSDQTYKYTRYYGKISGFERLKDARQLAKASTLTSYSERTLNMCILKIEITGEIWRGDSSGITNFIPDNLVTLFGTEIISFEEVKL